jgi:hypothetical protein
MTSVLHQLISSFLLFCPVSFIHPFLRLRLLSVFPSIMKLTPAHLILAGLATTANSAAVEPITVKFQGRTAVPSKRSSSVDVKFTNWWNVTDIQWYGKISVGTPPQDL